MKAVVSSYITFGKPLPLTIRSVKSNHQSYCRIHGYDYCMMHHHDSLPAISYSQSGFYLGTNSKPMYILELFERGYDSVFWIDSDSLFVSAQSLNWLDQFPIALCGDKNDLINTGHLHFMNTPVSIRLLRLWRDTIKTSFIDLPFESRLGMAFSEEGHPLFSEEGYPLHDQVVLNCLVSCDDCSSVSSLLDSFQSNNFYAMNSSRLHSLPYGSGSFYAHSFYLTSWLQGSLYVLPPKTFNSYLFGSSDQLYAKGDLCVHFVATDKFYLNSLFLVRSKVGLSEPRLFLVYLVSALRFICARIFARLLLIKKYFDKLFWI